MSLWDTLHQEAMSLHQQGCWAEAEQRYQSLLQKNDQADAVWSELGWLYYQTQQYPSAKHALSKALYINASVALYHYRYGLVLEQLGDRSVAQQAQRQALQLNPQFVDAHVALGRLLWEAGQLDSAEAIYRQAIAIGPHQVESHRGLARVFLARNQISEAVKTYAAACKLSPYDMDLLQELGATLELQASYEQARAAFYLGSAAYCAKDYQAALTHYQEFIDIPHKEAAPATIQRVYQYVGECYQKLDQPAAAIALYYQALTTYPEAQELYHALITLLQNSGRAQEAIVMADKGLQYFPADMQLQREKQLLLPILYEQTAEIERWRQQFTQGLDWLIQHIQLETLDAKQNALLGMGSQTNFYLQYQGQNDLELQVKYGQLMHQIVSANYPEWSQPLPLTPLTSQQKIRIGYISSFFWGHTVGKLFLGWVRHHNPQQFEVFCYHLGPTSDSITELFQQYSHTFRWLPLQEVLTTDFTTVAQAVRNDELHILVFLDLGMHPFLTSLAGLRLAPIQCVAWGHPITSGLPTLDYFLSSALMEPAHAESHYSEKLICLPNLSIAYAKPELPKLTKLRSEFQLREDSVIYLCCQSLFKYLPQYDYILAEIARRIPQAQFVFVSGFNDLLTHQFRRRLQRAFAALNLNAQDYCLVLPRQPQSDYWQLNLLADIFLDTFSWSGGNTTLEAIACGLPIVTCPGEFMRSRHSYAILQCLGVTETIAQDAADYIEIACKLGNDPEWRSQIVQQMAARQDRIYSDTTCVTALETFYQQAVQDLTSN